MSKIQGILVKLGNNFTCARVKLFLNFTRHHLIKHTNTGKCGMCPGYETSRSIVAGTLSLKENQMFTASDVIVCLKSKGVFFSF